MKKIFFSFVALAALAACSKSEVAYEASAEIGFAPAVKNVTKAAMAEGATLNTTDNLGIWAFWNGVNGAVEESNATYANYTDSYLANALFVNRNAISWGGQTSYPWPTNGALVFAGYNKPAGATFTAEYDGLVGNTMTFNDYTQSTDLANTFDLCWFGKTSRSYNNRANSEPVAVTMSHALTWITIKVKGDSNTAPTGEGALPWKVTKATLLDVNTVGTTGTCIFDSADGNKAKATWDVSEEEEDISNIIVKETPATKEDGVIVSGGTPLTQGGVVYESTANGLVVIPQTPVSLEIEYIYPVSSVYKEGKTTVNLTLEGTKKEDGTTENTKINTWLSGTHYTYTIVFKANEILVAPSYGTWTESNQSVTVE